MLNCQPCYGLHIVCGPRKTTRVVFISLLYPFLPPRADVYYSPPTIPAKDRPPMCDACPPPPPSAHQTNPTPRLSRRTFLAIGATAAGALTSLWSSCEAPTTPHQSVP